VTRVTIDTEMAVVLASLAGKEIELCDEAGNLVGWYAPARPKPTLQELIDSCPTSEEELDRRSRNLDTGRPLADILGELESS